MHGNALEWRRNINVSFGQLCCEMEPTLSVDVRRGPGIMPPLQFGEDDCGFHVALAVGQTASWRSRIR